MPKKLLTEWVSPSSYAKHRDMTLSQVKDLIDSGKIENCWKVANNNRKKINWRAADLAIKAAQEQADSFNDDQDDKPVDQKLGVNNLTKARTAKTTMEAKAAQLKYEQLAGSLVKTDDVISVAKDMGRLTKESLMTIPDRLAPILAGKTDIDDIHALLTEEIHTSLRNMKLENFDFFNRESNESI